jgi:hypothetical protein
MLGPIKSLASTFEKKKKRDEIKKANPIKKTRTTGPCTSTAGTISAFQELWKCCQLSTLSKVRVWKSVAQVV